MESPGCRLQRFEGRRNEGDAFRESPVAYQCRFIAGGPGQPVAIGLQVKFSPLGPRDRPIVFEALDEFIDVADLQLHPPPVPPAVVDALQEVVEKRQLHFPAIVGVKFAPMFA